MNKDPRQDSQLRLDLMAALERHGLAAYQSGKGKVFASCGKLGFIELIFAGEAGLAWRIWVYGEGDSIFPVDALHRAVEQLKARLVEVRRTLARVLMDESKQASLAEARLRSAVETLHYSFKMGNVISGPMLREWEAFCASALREEQQ